jgi:ABC-type sugar transport system substrate-binding protein
MKQTKSMKTLSAVMVLFSISSASASAQEPINLTPPETQALKELLQACDAKVQAQDKYAKLGDDMIDRQGQLLQKQNERIDQLESKNDNGLLYFVVGMLTTGLTVYLVKR